MKLVIAEKPSVGRVIADCLGIENTNKTYIQCKNDYIVTWCFGHLLELAEPDFYLKKDSKKNKWIKEDLPIFPEKWQFLAKQNSKNQLNLIGDLLKKSELIIHAGDPDREGQLLVDEVLDYFKNEKQVKRFWCSTQDQKSVTKALNNLEDNLKYKSWGTSAYARALADWLIGINLTRANSVASGYLIVVGRVKTPTLNLIVKRCNEIKDFQPIPYFKIKAVFTSEQQEINTLFKPGEDQKGLDSQGRLIDLEVVKEIVSSVSSVKQGIIKNIKDDIKTIGQPKGLSGANLAKIAFNLYGYSAQQTLELSQALYEKKITSYPRTDCEYLSNNHYQEAKEILSIIEKIPQYQEICKNVDLTIKSNIWNDKKITAHHAIIPTFHSFNIDILSENEANLYDIIVRNYIAQFYQQYEYNSKNITISCNNYDFITTIKKVLKLGWKTVFNDENIDENTDKNENQQELTINLNINDPVICSNIDFSKEKTKPPAYFTDSSIIDAMINIHNYASDEYKKYLKESDGIGTVATRANIIEELINNKYVERTGKGKKAKLISTETGENVINSLHGNIKEAAITAVFERHLKAIQEGSANIEPFLEKQKEFVIKEINRAFDSNRPGVFSCPDCGKPLVKRKGNNGFWFGCSGYPECKSTFDVGENGQPVKRVKKEIIKSGFLCFDCGADLIRRTGTSGKGKKAKKYDFFSCSGYPKCKSTFDVGQDGKPVKKEKIMKVRNS